MTIELSASQISTFLECQRKWGWRYIAGVRPPPAPSAALGSRVHAQLEAYLRGGEPFNFHGEEGYIAAAGLEHLPPPGTVEVEHSFSFQSPRTGYVYRGFIDALVPPRDGRAPVVIDHKTTSSLRWAKTPEVLRTDVQATIYAVHVMAKFRAPEVDLKWIYYQTKGTRKAVPVEVRLRSEEAGETFSLIEVVSYDIATTLQSVTAEEVLKLPPNASACEAYGGCPFRDRCNLSPAERMRSIMSNGSDLLSRLRARKAAEAIPQPVNPPEGAEPARLDPNGTEKPKTEIRAVLPTNAGTVSEADARPVALRNLETGKDTPIAPEPVAVDSRDGTPILVGEKPRRKYTRKEKPADTVPAPAAEPVEPEGFVLYVDCYPTGKPARFVDTLIGEAKADVEAETGKADYRFLEYGQGPGALRVAFLARFNQAEASDWIVYTANPETAIVLSDLVARAGLVVRASR